MLDRPEGKAALLAELDRATDEYEQQNVVNVLTRVDALGDISDDWVKRTKQNKKTNEYLKRLADRLAKERK